MCVEPFYSFTKTICEEYCSRSEKLIRKNLIFMAYFKGTI
nr:MAG TPA: hypothetical protein [Caudoviricetes sp.]